MQETSLLELFESALGRPRAPERPLPEHPLPEPDLEIDLWPIEVAEPEPLDPAPSSAKPRTLPPLRARLVTPALLVSLGLHVTPLAGLIAWGSAAPEIVTPIPVQLLIEQPPPPPKQEQKPAPSGPLASEDSGKMAAPPDAPIAKPAAPPPPPAEPVPAPKETKLAEVPPPPPKPKPRPKPPVQAAALQEVPKPAPPLPPPPRPPARAPQSLDSLFSDAVKNTGIPGPAATRDEYLAYLVTLTRQHIDLLPTSVVAGRRGEAVLSVLVLNDGTIARIAIRQSSGYSDIDQRIEQMIAAVRKFPPLPQWVQGPSMDLTMRMRFPEALNQ